MSASLVGSEMCIRDRHQCVHGTRPCFSAWRWGRARRTALSSPTMHSTRPVSYTHLTLPTICSV
eukprot:3997146-Alexandrium_andersonii.AAC.1